MANTTSSIDSANDPLMYATKILRAERMELEKTFKANEKRIADLEKRIDDALEMAMLIVEKSGKTEEHLEKAKECTALLCNIDLTPAGGDGKKVTERFERERKNSYENSKKGKHTTWRPIMVNINGTNVELLRRQNEEEIEEQDRELANATAKLELEIAQKLEHSDQKRFMFVGFIDDDLLTQQQIVDKLGGKVVANLTTCTHVIVDLSISLQTRNTKLYNAAASAKFLLSRDYLRRSKKEGRFLEEQEFELVHMRSPLNESIYGNLFDLAKTAMTNRINKTLPFANLRYLVIEPQASGFYSSVIKSGGGKSELINSNLKIDEIVEKVAKSKLRIDAVASGGVESLKKVFIDTETVSTIRLNELVEKLTAAEIKSYKCDYIATKLTGDASLKNFRIWNSQII